MLSLDDPLWQKLDDAHRDRVIPKIVAALAEKWDDEASSSLFWDCLCHQETCYGATYAVIPHLLRIAKPEENAHQRLEIALFLGFVARCAFQPGGCCGGKPDNVIPQGLPLTLDAWDRKLDIPRSLLARLEGEGSLTSYEQKKLLRYRQRLAVEPVNEGDLEKLKAIAAEFFDSLPEISGLCAQALDENAQDADALPYLLGGVAAANGHSQLAHLLNSGPEGVFNCPNCNVWIEYMLFGDRIAIYAFDPEADGADLLSHRRDRSLMDYNDGAATRCDGFIFPMQQGEEAIGGRIARLLELAAKLPDRKPLILIQNFLGSFICPKCSAERRVAGERVEARRLFAEDQE